jgi:hypothetical protein
MEFFNLDPTNLSTDCLYRIQYNDCKTTYSPLYGLSARDTETFYTDRDDIFNDFGGAVEDHLCWRKERDSLFISLFADKRHAENWALDWSARHDDRLCQIFEIKASELVGGYVFHADELRRTLHLHVPEGAEASIRDEYLVTYRIPPQAIVSCRNSEDIKQGAAFFFKCEI